MSSYQPLFKHQEYSVNFFAATNRGLDFSDPGTGKTRVQIEAFLRHRRAGGKCALVIAPKSLLKSAWADDFNRFAPGLVTSIAYAQNRERAFATNADVYITNTDGVNWLAKQHPTFFAEMDTLIIDEVSYFKHATSLRSKNLAKIVKYFPRRYALTGTPTANGILDIFNPVKLVDDGRRLGGSFFQFRNGVCTPEQVGPMPNMVKWVAKVGAEAAVSSLIQDIVVRHKFEECLDIPENFTTPVTHYLPTKVVSAYEDLERLSLTVFDDNTSVSAVNAAAITTKLLQVASGAVYNDNGEYTVIDTSRYELISEMTSCRQSCIIFYHWDHQRDGIAASLTAADISYRVIDGDATDKKRDEAVFLFQHGMIKVLLCHPKSAAHGLTLTKGTTTIWASPTYNLEHYLQGNRRIYRAGQTQKTETIVILADGTLETKVFEKLNDKDAKQLDLLTMLKEHSQRARKDYEHKQEG